MTLTAEDLLAISQMMEEMLDRKLDEHHLLQQGHVLVCLFHPVRMVFIALVCTCIAGLMLLSSGHNR